MAGVHEDFGEKIGGAKKDLWKDRGLYADDLEAMNEREAEKFVKKDKAAEAGCVLGLVLLHDLRDPGHGVPYGQRLHRKVDAVPFQAQYLAAAQAVQRGDVDDGVEAFVLDGGQQVSHLRFRVERAGKLCSVGHDDQIGGVCLDQTVPLRQFERLIEHVLVLTQANRG